MGLENNLMATITVTIIPGRKSSMHAKINWVKVIGITGNLCSFKDISIRFLLSTKVKRKNSTEGETKVGTIFNQGMQVDCLQHQHHGYL